MRMLHSFQCPYGVLSIRCLEPVKVKAMPPQVLCFRLFCSTCLMAASQLSTMHMHGRASLKPASTICSSASEWQLSWNIHTVMRRVNFEGTCSKVDQDNDQCSQ